MNTSLIEEGDSVSNKEVSVINFIQLVEDLFLPEIKSGFDKPIVLNDFTAYLETCDSKFIFAAELIKNEPSSFESPYIDKFRMKCLSSVFILAGQHSCTNMWTTKVTNEKSVIILNVILNYLGYSTPEEALNFDNCNLFKNILSRIRPWLLKDTWKNFPAGVACYIWILGYIKSPNLSEHMDLVLPTALIITDDFVIENSIIGLKCLEHIICNVPITQLSWYGQDEVILKALEPIFFHKEVEAIIQLIKTFVTLLKKKHPIRSYEVPKINEFDNSIDKLIRSMLHEQKLNLRSAYMKCLPDVISARGLGILFHSTVLVNVIVEYVLEPTSSLEALLVLETFIDVCWLRMSVHCKSFLILIAKCILGLKSRGYPPEIQPRLQEIFKKLKKLCPNEVEQFSNDIIKEKSLKEVVIAFELQCS